MSIKFDVIQHASSPYYGEWEIKNIHSGEEKAIEVKDFLAVSLFSPVALDNADADFQFDHWSEKMKIELKHCEKVEKDKYFVQVAVRKEAGGSFILGANENFHIRLNSATGHPDLTDEEAMQKYIATIALSVDALPSYEAHVLIKADQLPSGVAEIADDFELIFKSSVTTKTFKLPFRKETEIKLLPGTYKVSGKRLSNTTHTKEIDPVPSVTTLKLEAGDKATLAVNFPDPKYYCTLELTMDFPVVELIHEKIKLDFTVEGTDYHRSFTYCAQPPYKTTLYHLPSEGYVSIKSKDIWVNNQLFRFDYRFKLDNEIIPLNITRDDVFSQGKNPENPQPLFVSVKTEKEFDGLFELCLNPKEGGGKYRFFLDVENMTDYEVPDLVGAGTYDVVCKNFIHDKTVYTVECPHTLEVKTDEPPHLSLTIKEAAHLGVRGFDAEHLTFGGCTTLEPHNKIAFEEARTHSIFKYAGVDGGGDPHTILKTDMATIHTVELAQDIENALAHKTSGKKPHKVLPVMVSYTCQLSGNDIAVLRKEEALKNSMANYILTLATLMHKKGAEKGVAGGVIVNPDMLGACIQNGLAPTYAMPVKKPLKEALEKRAETLKRLMNLEKLPQVPEDLTEDIKGYIAAVNWLTKTLAPDVVFGWQVNIWGYKANASSAWIYGDTPVKSIAQELVGHVKQFGVYSGKYCPDFLAIDRYEADDFTIRSYRNLYCYGPHEWKRYFEFCGQVSSDLKIPVMPWQIPASHTPLATEAVEKDPEKMDTQHWGTAGTYIFGDPKMGDDVEKMNPVLLKFSFKENNAPNLAALVGDTPKELYTRKGGFDVTDPAYTDFPVYGIFHIQLGGGSTLGMVPPTMGDNVDIHWANSRLAAYDENPVPFKDTLV